MVISNQLLSVFAEKHAKSNMYKSASEWNTKLRDSEADPWYVTQFHQ